MATDDPTSTTPGDTAAGAVAGAQPPLPNSAEAALAAAQAAIAGLRAASSGDTKKAAPGPATKPAPDAAAAARAKAPAPDPTPPDLGDLTTLTEDDGEPPAAPARPKANAGAGRHDTPANGHPDHAPRAADRTDPPTRPFDFPEWAAGRLSETDSAGIRLLSQVNLNVRIELGRTRMLVEDVLKLAADSVVELDKLAGDPVDIYVNDRHVARGEVLVLNDNFCVRINEIIAQPGQIEDAAAEAGVGAA